MIKYIIHRTRRTAGNTLRIEAFNGSKGWIYVNPKAWQNEFNYANEKIKKYNTEKEAQEELEKLSPLGSIKMEVIEFEDN